MENRTKRILLAAGIMFFCINLHAQDEGETIFKSTCSACHKISNARLVGPGLANINKKCTEQWFISFVKSSQTMVKNGDPQAVAIFEEFNKTVMPDQNFTDAQIKSVWAYIIAKSPAETGGATASTESTQPSEPAEPERQATAEDIVAGENLFVGKTKFAHGGPTCNACHNVKNDKVVTGGALAKDLTGVYGRLTGDGVKAILGSPPFPAMKQAFQDHPLTEDEIFQLTAFLKVANEEQLYQQPRDYGKRMLYTGIIGAFILMGVFPALWFRRKSKTVNTRIYDRQVKSTN